MELTKCPICSLEDLKEDGRSDSGADLKIRYHCSRCGTFKLSRIAYRYYAQKMNNAKLSAWIREHKEYDRQEPEITPENFNSIRENLPNYTPAQKQLLLLRKIERDTKYPGEEIFINPSFDYPVAWAFRAEEFAFYLKALICRELITSTCPLDRLTQIPLYGISLTIRGWEYLEEYSLIPAFLDQVFIAMSFSQALINIYENGIKKGVENAGYKPYRVDIEPHLERIDAKIITEIRNSRFLVADVTEQRPGVYFEAGFAMGLKLPVIWSVRKNEIDKVHFDTRQYNHIIWETPEDLGQELYYRICATIGEIKKRDIT